MASAVFDDRPKHCKSIDKQAKLGTVTTLHSRYTKGVFAHLPSPCSRKTLSFGHGTKSLLLIDDSDSPKC